MIRKHLWLTLCLGAAFFLAFTGCSSPAQPDQQKITAAFKAINLSGALDGTGVGESSLRSKATVSSQSWSGTNFTSLNFSSDISNIVIIGDTATATGSFTFSGEYTFSGASWTTSGSFSATGQGMVNFIKEDDIWKVDDIPMILLKSNNAGGHGPDMTQITCSLKDVAAGNPVDLMTHITSMVQAPAQHLGFFVVTRGFVSFVNHSPVWTINNAYNYNATISTAPLNYKGNHYGAIVAYQLVKLNPTDETSYRVYFAINITMFKIH